MAKEKTIKQWVEDSMTWTTEEKQKFLRESQRNGLSDAIEESFEGAVGGAFIWASSEDGHDYWERLRDKELVAIENLYDYSAE